MNVSILITSYKFVRPSVHPVFPDWTASYPNSSIGAAED